MKIRDKLLVLILSAMLLVFSAMIYLSYATSKHLLVEQIQQNAVNMLNRYRTVLETDLAAMADVAKDEAVVMESLGSSVTPEDITRYLKNFVAANPEIYGSAISFVPGAISGGDKLFGPYFYRGKAGIEYVDLTTPAYNYPKWDWFKVPLETGKPRWSSPYVDDGGGNVAMVTYSYPFFKGDKVWGVSTIDLSLMDLTKEIKQIKVGESGFAFLIDKDGTFLSLRSGDKTIDKTLFKVAEETQVPGLRVIAEKMTAGRTGFDLTFNPLIKKHSWIAYGPLRSTGWSLGIVFPEDELLAELKILNHQIIYIAFAGALLIFIAIYYVSEHISNPITSLVNGARRISAGDFTTKLETVSSRDEVGALSRAFVEMEDSLVKTLSNLHEEKEQFKVAFSQMTDGLAILNTDCMVLQFNKNAGNWLQLPTSLSLYEHLPKIFAGQFPSKDDCKVKQCTFKLARKNVNDTQKELHLECTISPIFDENGVHKEYVFSSRDITETETEERSKRDFLSLMSHKLFTPLTVLQGKLMLWKDGLLGSLDEKQMKHVNSMADQTAKLNDLIGSLVNFVSMEENKFDTSREELDLGKTLNEVAERCRQWFADKNPIVDIKVEEGAGKFTFNKKLFEVMTSQLIENGLKFNLSVPPRVQVNCRRIGKETVIGIIDNGVGIPREYHEKIFEKFYQIEKYYTGNVEGVGLGLAYVKKIVEAFGGRIEVSSEPGKGSVFTLKFTT